MFYCIFNGTWSANPSISVAAGNTNALSAIMHVFRGLDVTTPLDVAQVVGNYAAPASPYDVTITGITTVTNGAWVVAVWGSTYTTAPTWALQTAGWANVGGAQYRNTSGANQVSASAAYKLVSPAGASGNVTNRESGAGLGTSHILALRPGTPPPVPVATAATNIQATSFSANWNASAGAIGYVLDVATDSGFTSFVTGYRDLIVNNVLTYSVSSNILANTTYYYRVRAYSGTGVSDNSNTISLTTACAGPGIAVDTVTSGTGTSSPITVSHTTLGTNRLMLVGISGAVSSGTVAVSGVTYGGVALSLVGTATAAAYQKTWIYQLVAPATGTANVVVTFSTAPNTGAVVGVMTFTGVDQSVPLGTFAGANGTSAAPSVNVSSASGELVFDTVNHYWPLTVGANQTQRWNTGSGSIYGGGSSEPGAATVTMSWTASGSDTWAIGAVPIKPAALACPPVATAATNILPYSFSANWNASSVATGYQLDVATDSGFTSFVTGYNNLDVGNVLTYSVSSLAPSTTYYYRVRAYNGNGAGGNSNTISLSTAVATLLSFNSKYVVTSSTAATTTSATLVDDTEASQTFILAATQTVLVIYQANSVNGAAMINQGMQNAISVDGADVANSWDSAFAANYPTRNAVFWIGTLASGFHAIKGRVASNNSGNTVTVSNRVLVIYVLDGNAFLYRDDSTASTAPNTTFINDPQASFTFTPSSSCKALVLYNVSNSGVTESTQGKRAAISISGGSTCTNCSQAEKSPGTVNYADSVFTLWASGLSASSTTVTGRFASNAAAAVTVDRRQLGVLMFADTTLLDYVSSDTQVPTTSSSLQNDGQATITKPTTDTRELLVVAMGTKRTGTSSNNYGERYGISVDTNDRANSRGSASAGATSADSAATAWAENLAAGSHTIQGRFSNNNTNETAAIDSRRIVALWFPVPTQTLLTFNSKYIVTSSTAVPTTSNTLVDDTQASQTFSLTASQTVLVIYQANNLYGTAMHHSGMQNAISVDGGDVANSWDSPFDLTYVARNTVFWVGTLGSGSHTIKGRFASNNSGSTATLSSRVLVIYVLNGDAYRYLDNSTTSTSSSTTLGNDGPATFTFTPPGSCKGLFLYNVANSTGATETGKGKKAAIRVGSTDYSRAEKSPAEANDADSVFTLWAMSLTAASTTVTGRFAESEAGGTVTINRRQLGVLMFDDSTLLDTISSDTVVTTTSSSLVYDPQASGANAISRTTTDARELLVVAMGTKRLGTVSSNEGECYGIMVNGTDRASSRGSNSWSSATSGDGPGSEAPAWAETLAAGGHTIEGRFSNNTGTSSAVIDSRRIAALWFSTSLPPPAPVATAATNIQGDSFSANWNASGSATGYLLDVATDSGFTSFVSGYQDLDVGPVLTYSVANWPISPGTTYYYRVRAYNDNGTSGNSNTISLTTLAGLMLGNHTLWQVTNRFTTTSPVSDVLFRFNLSRGGTVTVDTLRVNFTITGGVVNADVTSGALYVDVNNDGMLDGGDTLIQGSVTPVAGVLTFTTDFTPATSGTNYLVLATVANLAVGDTTTFSVGTTDIDVLPGGVAKLYSISDATHRRISVSSLYRSVGTNANNLNTGGRTVTVSGTTATFSGAMPNNVGVGDVLTYTSGTAQLAFISGRTSSTVFTVQDKIGGTPTAASAATVGVYRAYTSLANWQSQTENPLINEPVENDVNPSKNLVSANTIMSVACYADGADTALVNIDGWTTGANTYINIFTPYLSSEVGVTQRHSGTWDATKYRLVAALDYFGVMRVQDDYVRVTGLQIENTRPKGNRPAGIEIRPGSATSEVRVSQNILRATGTGTGDWWCAAIAQTSVGGVVKAWNNIMYNWGAGFFSEYTSSSSGVTLYNNTVVSSDNVGIELDGHASGSFRLANNLVQGAATNYYFAAGVTLDYSATNLSQDATSPQTSLRNKTVSFAGAADYHLASGDTNAKDQGTSLSSDPNLPFSDDIDGQSRPYGSAWDIGADEYVSGLFGYRRQITVGDTMTPASCGSDLSNFPVLVSITNDANLKTVANGGHVAHTNGYDIIFRALDGKTQLDHEIESYDGSTGTLVAWVRIPTLAYNANTSIYMYYGNAGIIAPTANPAGVWGTSYMGVWHLKETGSGTAGEYKDSSQYVNDGQGGRGNSSYVPKQTGGQIGFGQQFDNLVDGKYDLVDVGNGSALNITGNQITLEAWVRHNLSAPYAHDSWGFVNRKGWSSGYRLLMQTSGYGCAPLCVHFGLGEGSNFLGTATLLTAGSWHHVVGTYDGSLMRVFIDGVQDANTLSKTAAITAPLPPEDHVWIGYGDQPTDVSWSSEWQGQIDEVRISNVARSACWIQTSYNNANSPGTFVTPGAEQAAGPTAADVVSLDATGYPGRGVLVSWHTGFEVDNLGFHVYREQGGQRVRLTPSLVAGSALFAGAGTPLTAGRSYTWWDSSPVAGASYWLEEWELSGVRRWHGPVQVQAGAVGVQAQGLAVPPSGASVKTSSALLAGLGQGVSPSPPQGVRRKLRQALGMAEERRAVQWGLASRPAVKFLVSEEGWYRVSQEELVRAGLDPGVDPSRLQLFADGVQVPILVDVKQHGVFASGDGIEFYGEGLDTPSTAVRVYWLTVGLGEGLRIPEASGGGRWAPGPGSFPYEVERADRTLYFPGLLNGDEDNFFGAVVTSTPVAQTVRVPHVDQAGPGELVVRLQGGTAGTHRVGVELNGTRVGTAVWEGLLVGEVVVPLGTGMISEGDNQVTLAAEGGEGDASAVASIRIQYAHTWDADGEALEFSLGGYQEVTIRGFRGSQVRVVDITDPWAVQVLPVEVVKQGETYQARVGVPEPGERTLLAVGTGAVRHPVGVQANRPSAWHAATGGADLVIIAHRSLLSAVEPLRALRESQGLKVAVVDVENVYDEFSFGAKDPQAIKDLLACAKDTWSRPPRYLLLVGDASYDPRNYLLYGYLDLVPTKLVDTKYLETASDDWFADFDGDGIGDIPVGRIPVQTATDAGTVIGKIVAYEGSAKLGRVLLVADANDKDNDFEGLTGQVKAVLPSTVWVVEVDRGQLGDGAAKLQLMNGIDLGQTLINYVGHGTVDAWGAYWVTAAEARALGNDRYGLVVSMTCLNGFFDDPFQLTMAEAFLAAPAGGAVAVWASSGLTESKDQLPIDEALVRLLFSGASITLGDATRAAKAAASDMDVRRTWILFGDPTTRLRR